MSTFISEDDLKTFEGWLRYQGIDLAALTPEELSMWKAEYAATRERAAAQPKIGLMKLPPLPAGEHRYAVALRDGAELWLTLWVRRSRKREIFVMIPRGTEDWNPHISYHLDGTIHAKSYGQKFPSPKRQPLGSAFKGAEPLGAYAGHAPKSEGALCDPVAFSGIVEVPSGVLGPRHGAVTVDLVEPGCEPREHPWAQIYQRVTFKDAVPWVVITVGRPLGEGGVALAGMPPAPPYRRMPLGYLAAWVGFIFLLVLYQNDWPGTSLGAWAERVSSALIGGGLFGWISWRFYAYKKFQGR